ncbi:hypothetical protein [uncultured Methanosphaera sp.]|uniref:hypothetical protein n=1 Tax=uncultured Methanosphaera sp. TaxID=262501 RepID=UPI00259A1B2C|nr:hypothetical protein [uncultured Methanosphaera sp.]
MQLYLLHHTFRNETIPSYHNGRSPTLTITLTIKSMITLNTNMIKHAEIKT